VKTLYKNIFEVLKIVKLDIYALDIRRNIHREHIKRLLKNSERKLAAPHPPTRQMTAQAGLPLPSKAT
jgi:hypothetical protein